MKAARLYRIAAVLLLLFAVGHTLGFSQIDPTWKIDAVVGSLRTTHFNFQGFDRTFWDFFVGAGCTVGVLYLCAACLAWQLGGLPAEMQARLRACGWALSVCFAAIAVVSWKFLFVIPIAFSALIAACLAVAAWRSTGP